MPHFDAATKIVFPHIYIVHLPDLMAAFIKRYEKNVKGFVDDKGCPSNCMKSIKHSLFWVFSFRYVMNTRNITKKNYHDIIQSIYMMFPCLLKLICRVIL